MVSRKRAREEDEKNNHAAPSQEHGLLHQLRNMWEFANLMQYIYSFGKMMKIDDDIDIEDLEAECLKPGHSERLLNIGLSLLKFVSSHRGLTYDNFEEYTRRQYYAKAPNRNPFGDDDEPTKFYQLDTFQKIRVLQQLSAWTLWNPDRFRERMPEQKEIDQTQWRIEELGYDSDERLYYLLDDNRLYRRTDPAIPSPKATKPKANSKKGRAAARAAKRRKVSETESTQNQEDGKQNDDVQPDEFKWECIAVSLAEYNSFLDKLSKTKDPDEQVLRDRLVEQVIPTLEKVEESQQKKALRREKELANLQKLATAKRSSRIAGKHERERQEMEAVEEAKKQAAEQAAALKEQEMRGKIEKERLYRLMTREQRLKDREERRRQQEEELSAMAEKAKKAEEGDARVSERRLKTEMEKRKKDLEELGDEGQWVFDCSGCGVHGKNLDDGSHSIACENCNVWQHSKCLGVSQVEAEKEDFHFVCADCQRRSEEAKRPKIPPLKFRLTTSSSPPSKEATSPEKAKRAKRPSIEQHPPSHGDKQSDAILTGNATGQSKPATNGKVSIQSGVHNLPPAPTHASSLSSNVPIAPSRPQTIENGTPHGPPQDSHATYPSMTNPMDTASSLAAHVTQSGAYGRPERLAEGEVQRSPFMNQPSNSTSFNSQRPSSSGSIQSSFRSPIQNRPSMSPTQGNRDVGPLAGFPPPPTPVPAPSPVSSGVPVTPFGQNQSYQHGANNGPSYPPPTSSHQTPPVSFSSTTPANPQTSSFGQISTPTRYSPGIPMSGLSPTKNSPARPPSFGEAGHPSIIPPVQKLHPSPKLMGRPSPNTPIPAPVKNMTPEHGHRFGNREQMESLAQLNNNNNNKNNNNSQQGPSESQSSIAPPTLLQPSLEQREQQEQGASHQGSVGRKD